MEKSVSYNWIDHAPSVYQPHRLADSKAGIATNVSEVVMQFNAQDAKNKDLADKAVGSYFFCLLSPIIKGGLLVGVLKLNSLITYQLARTPLARPHTRCCKS